MDVNTDANTDVRMPLVRGVLTRKQALKLIWQLFGFWCMGCTFILGVSDKPVRFIVAVTADD